MHKLSNKRGQISSLEQERRPMVGDDQFSFPVVSNPVSHLMQSSPLWRISSRVYHHNESEKRAGENEEDTDSFYSIVLERSSIEAEASSRTEENREEVVVEEKIDMLWEDFFCKEETMAELEGGEAEGKRTQLCVSGGGRIAARDSGGGVVSLVAVAKLMKKMFLIGNKSAHKS